MGPTRPRSSVSPERQGLAANGGSLSQSFVLAAVTFAIGQLANLTFQIVLLKSLGATTYAVVGLAHLLLLTLIFLADLGYASLFLREDRHASHWLVTWRCALGQRLLATLVLMGLALTGWVFYSDDQAGRQYLFSAAPASLFALFNFSAPLIAAGQRLRGLMAAQIAWPAGLLLWWPVSVSLPLSAAASAGLAVSLGYLTQAIVNFAMSGQRLLWLPLLGKGQLRAALHLCALSVSGTLHDRLTPFLLAPLVPGFMPVFLLLNHVLSGLSGVQGQLSRLLLGQASSAGGRQRIVAVASLLAWATANMLLLGTLAQSLELPIESRQWLALAGLVVLAWGLSASSGFLVLLLIGERREGQFVRPFLLGLGASAVLQLMAAWSDAPASVLWARVVGMLLVMSVLLVMLRLRPGRWGMLALAGALATCAAAQTSWATGLAIMLAVPAMIGLLGRRPCYIEPRCTGGMDE
ncbi:putative membrane protein [Pseudomonas sp. Os17]|nr:putative membrane protein [Pseudomonas sp. Os17]